MKKALALIALLVVSPFLYFGAYHFMLTAKHGHMDIDTGAILKFTPEYWFGGRATEFLFAPAHAFDRLLRPDDWKGTPPISPLANS